MLKDSTLNNTLTVITNLNIKSNRHKKCIIYQMNKTQYKLNNCKNIFLTDKKFRPYYLL